LRGRAVIAALEAIAARALEVRLTRHDRYAVLTASRQQRLP